jgi:hypothetical protein
MEEWKVCEEHTNYSVSNLGNGNKKFRAFITFEGKMKTIGYFKTEEEGAKAYNDFILSHSLEEYTPLNDLV